MNRRELENLRSERGEVLRMLKNIPQDRVIDRGSMEYRLRQLEDMINASSEHPIPARAVMTFRGKPVVGNNEGIYYGFATKAISSFADAVVLAERDGDELSDLGPIPGKKGGGLIIKDTVIGSFGFELEEVIDSDQKPEEETRTAQALKQVGEILMNTQASDDELAQSISDVHPRVLRSLQSFLEHLAASGATAAFQVNDHTFRFDQIAEISRGAERLKTENVKEDEDVIRGRFIGLLPKRRTFEFVKEGETETLVGKVMKGLEDISIINNHLDAVTDVKFKVTRVGQGRPSYVLMEVPTW
mgnify:CR=1 FL=1